MPFDPAALGAGAIAFLPSRTDDERAKPKPDWENLFIRHFPWDFVTLFSDWDDEPDMKNVTPPKRVRLT
jgi:hypothetical protein